MWGDPDRKCRKISELGFTIPKMKACETGLKLIHFKLVTAEVGANILKTKRIYADTHLYKSVPGTSTEP